MSFLEIDQVHKSYGHHEVLKGVTLNVERHEVVCLIGASGSGKSTLLRCVNALEDIQSGAIRIEGDTVTGAGVDLNVLRRDVGIVFQSYNLFPHMSVIENVMLAPTRVGGVSKSEARARGEALLVAKLWETQLFNLSPVTLVAFLFILITIPQARFVDWLIDRDARRRAGGS